MWAPRDAAKRCGVRQELVASRHLLSCKGVELKRRAFITLGGAVLAWPLGAPAQQLAKTHRVGVLVISAPLADLLGPDPISPAITAFVHELRKFGYVERKNLVMEWRSAEGRYDRYPELIRELVAAGVVVSAGHTNASYAEIHAALAHGLSGFTHLFNAMSQLTPREPGTVGAALDDQGSWCGIIVDGEHTDPVVLRIALRCKPHDRFVLVTDAMPSVGTNQASFELQGRRIKVHGQACVDEDGRLAGSNLDMASCVRNAVAMLGVPLPQAVRMASQTPAEFLGVAAEYGRIAAGQRANLVLTDDTLNVRETWIDGRSSRETLQPSAAPGS